VVYGVRELPAGDAWWSPAHEVILMRPGLLQVERRCALAHELGHRELGHAGQCAEYGDADRQARRVEGNADGWAARKLIGFDDLVRVGRWTGSHVEAADELWVTPRILEVRMRRLAPYERAVLRQEGVQL